MSSPGRLQIPPLCSNCPTVRGISLNHVDGALIQKEIPLPSWFGRSKWSLNEHSSILPPFLVQKGA